MSAAEQTARAGLALAVALAGVSALLVYWLWHERRVRPDSLSREDAVHFVRQDLRRLVVALVLLLLAGGMGYGSSLPPRIGGRANPSFVLIWFGVFVLVLSLLVLAVFDWLATRFYARRQIRDLGRERMEILREELRVAIARRAELGGPDEPAGGISGS